MDNIRIQQTICAVIPFKGFIVRCVYSYFCISGFRYLHSASEFKTNSLYRRCIFVIFVDILMEAVDLGIHLTELVVVSNSVVVVFFISRYGTMTAFRTSEIMFSVVTFSASASYVRPIL